MTKPPVFFFVHVMKTGGTTFVQHLPANFAEDQLYPTGPPGEERQRAYYMIDELVSAAAERGERIRAYSGHFPYIASQLVGADVTMTILRDPVDRIVSYLRQCKRHQPRMKDLSLEEIYDDAWAYPTYIHNYQVKLFAMTRDDKLESHIDLIDIDDGRLATAKEQLEQVDVMGLNDYYDEFVVEVQRRYGWTIGRVPNMRVSTEGWDVSPAFRQHIALDNAADVAFYEHAVALHASRRRRGQSNDG